MYVLNSYGLGVEIFLLLIIPISMGEAVLPNFISIAH